MRTFIISSKFYMHSLESAKPASCLTIQPRTVMFLLKHYTRINALLDMFILVYCYYSRTETEKLLKLLIVPISVGTAPVNEFCCVRVPV